MYPTHIYLKVSKYTSRTKVYLKRCLMVHKSKNMIQNLWGYPTIPLGIQIYLMLLKKQEYHKLHENPLISQGYKSPQKVPNWERSPSTKDILGYSITPKWKPKLLFYRGAPDARVITLSSVWHKYGTIFWDDPDYAQNRKYRASQAYNQSKLANVLFTRELARRLDGTGVNAYCVNPGLVSTGLGMHIVPGLGCLGSVLAGLFWLPWLT